MIQSLQLGAQQPFDNNCQKLFFSRQNSSEISKYCKFAWFIYIAFRSSLASLRIHLITRKAVLYSVTHKKAKSRLKNVRKLAWAKRAKIDKKTIWRSMCLLPVTGTLRSTKQLPHSHLHLLGYLMKSKPVLSKFAQCMIRYVKSVYRRWRFFNCAFTAVSSVHCRSHWDSKAIFFHCPSVVLFRYRFLCSD